MALHKSKLTKREAKLLKKHGSTTTKKALGEALLRRAERGLVQFAGEEPGGTG